MARIPYPPPSQFPPISASQPPVNTIKLLSHSPSTVTHWTAIGTAHYRELQLPKRLRELTILYCAAKFQSAYEWDHHVIVSAKILTEQEWNVIKRAFEGVGNIGTGVQSFFREGGGKDVFPERERILLKFLEEVTSEPTVTDQLWEEVQGKFSTREIVEVMSLQHYKERTMLGTVLQVDMDEFALKEKVKAKL
ncbi:hypothetical protein N431DRAFT_457549 [Stipitochalara longipes BDJ]|nr:hypothetical protein N431DRAFT_457549 [Stipitochalara longipes BDJ]